MKNQEYVAQVLAGQYPSEVRVPLDDPFVDDRGVIQNIWLGMSGSVTLITSKAGSVRAQHTHERHPMTGEEDWHAIYLVSGFLEYLEGKDKTSVATHYVYPGQIIFTPPHVYHEVRSVEDSVFITINGILKNHDNYHQTMVKHD